MIPHHYGAGRRELRSGRVGVLVAIAVGGALGTLVRYEVALTEPVHEGRFPWATFVVNMVGALLVGGVVAFATWSRRVHPLLRPFAAVGVCGGLTTFSTWMVDCALLVRDGQVGVAVVDVVASVAGGVLAVVAGFVVVRRLLHSHGWARFDPREAD